MGRTDVGGRRMKTERRCEWARRGGRGRGRKSPAPGRNTRPPSARRRRNKLHPPVSFSWMEHSIRHSREVNQHPLIKKMTFTMRHVPVWVEAILQERGMIFPDTKDWSFWSCWRRDLKRRKQMHERRRRTKDSRNGWGSLSPNFPREEVTFSFPAGNSSPKRRGAKRSAELDVPVTPAESSVSVGSGEQGPDGTSRRRLRGPALTTGGR